MTFVKEAAEDRKEMSAVRLELLGLKKRNAIKAVDPESVENVAANFSMSLQYGCHYGPQLMIASTLK